MIKVLVISLEWDSWTDLHPNHYFYYNTDGSTINNVKLDLKGSGIYIYLKNFFNVI